MSGLVLKLGPRERIMINGVVMENGDRRTRLNVLTPDANVLRLRDAIHPDEANTSVRRVACCGCANSASRLPNWIAWPIRRTRFCRTGSSFC